MSLYCKCSFRNIFPTLFIAHFISKIYYYSGYITSVPLNTLNVETPIQFLKLKLRVFDGLYDKIYVKPGAHHNVLSQVPIFSDFVNENLEFSDEHGNVIELTPSNRKLSTYFIKGHIPLTYLPNTYKVYKLGYFGPEFEIKAEDVDAITFWPNAEDIKIVFGPEEPRNEFIQRMDELKEQDQIKKVEIIQPMY